MNRKQYLAAAAVVAIGLLFVTACGKSSSPVAPSGATAAVSSAPGASITGTVTGTASGSTAGYTRLDNTSGVSVTIAGTNVTVAVDSNGKFVFTGVPAGTVQLVFTAGGATSTITLEGVQATDKITIKVIIKGTTAALDTEERNGQTVTEIEDQISSITLASRTLTVGATAVSVPAAATIRHGGTTVTFESLKVGDRVHVRGALGGAVFVATEVIVQNTNANVPVNVTGAITSAVTGSCPAISFVVGGYTVDTDKNTDFQKADCRTVAKGTSVHVKGDVQQPAGHVLATWVQIGK